MTAAACPKCGSPLPKVSGPGAIVTCEGCGVRFKTRSARAAQAGGEPPRVQPKAPPGKAPPRIVPASPPPPATEAAPVIQPRIEPGAAPATAAGRSSAAAPRPAAGPVRSSNRAAAPARGGAGNRPLLIGGIAGCLAVAGLIIALASRGGGNSGGGGGEAANSGSGGAATRETAIRDPFETLKSEAKTSGAPVAKLLEFGEMAQTRLDAALRSGNSADAKTYERESRWAFEAILRQVPDHEQANQRLGNVKFDMDEAERFEQAPGLDQSLKDDLMFLVEEVALQHMKDGRRTAWLKPSAKGDLAARWSALKTAILGAQAAARAKGEDPWYGQAYQAGTRLAAALSAPGLVDFRLDGATGVAFHVEAHKPYVFLVQKSAAGYEARIASDWNTVLQSLIETFQSHFGERTGLRPMDGPAAIVILRNANEYAKYIRKDDISRPVTSGGHFEPGTNRIVVYMSQEDRERTVLFHEGTHQIVEWAMRGAPGAGSKQALWFSEGIAEYFGGNSIEFIDGKKSFVPGLLNIESVKTCADSLERGDLMPLRELLDYSRSDYNRESGIVTLGRKVANAYAQGWALCYYLIEWEKDLYREKFVEYTKGEFAGKTGSRHFASIFGADGVDTIETGYRAMMVELDKCVKEGRVLSGRPVRH